MASGTPTGQCPPSHRGLIAKHPGHGKVRGPCAVRLDARCTNARVVQFVPRVIQFVPGVLQFVPEAMYKASVWQFVPGGCAVCA